MRKIKVTLNSIIFIIAVFCIALPVYAAQYKYDNLNRLIDVTYESGKKIHYTYDASGNMLGMEVTTASQEVKSITADSTSYTLKVGEANKPVISVLYLDGTTSIINEGLTFSSSDSSVASVDPTGTVKALKAGKTEITAKYKDKTVAIKVEVLSTVDLKVCIEGNGSVIDWNNGGVKSYTMGTSIVLKAVAGADSVFMYWKDISGRIISTNTEYSFTIGYNDNLQAVFAKKNRIMVTFMNGNNDIIKSVFISEGSDVVFPEAPSMYGYTFDGWDKTIDEIKKATGDIIVTTLYKKTEEKYNIKVNGGLGSGAYPVRDIVSIVANMPNKGEKFSHWVDELGNVFGYDTSLKFYALRDITITAVYVPETQEVEQNAQIAITKTSKTKGIIAFVAERVVPNGNTVVSHGILVTKNSSIGSSNNDFKIVTTDVLMATSKTKGLLGTFVLNKKAVLGERWYARGFLIYKDSQGNLFTIYSDISFDTMDLQG